MSSEWAWATPATATFQTRGSQPTPARWAFIRDTKS